MISIPKEVTLDLKKLGYDFVHFTEEEQAIVEKFGGVFFEPTHRAREGVANKTLCTCGILYPIIVNKCFFCDNDNFNRQMFYDKVYNKDEKNHLVINQYHDFSNKNQLKLDNLLELKFTKSYFFYDFTKNEKQITEENHIFYLGFIKDTTTRYREYEYVFFNQDKEQIHYQELIKVFNKSRKDFEYMLSYQGDSYKFDKKSYPIANVTTSGIGKHDYLFKHFPQEILNKIYEDYYRGAGFYSKETYSDYDDYKLEEKLYDFSKSKTYEFFKLTQFEYELLKAKANAEQRSFFKTFKQKNIKLLQQTKGFYTAKMMQKYPLFKELSIEMLNSLYKDIIANKHVEHSLEDLFEYFDYMRQYEVLEPIDVLNYYTFYLTKTKNKAEKYPKNLKALYKKLGGK